MERNSAHSLSHQRVILYISCTWHWWCSATVCGCGLRGQRAPGSPQGWPLGHAPPVQSETGHPWNSPTTRLLYWAALPTHTNTYSWLHAKCITGIYTHTCTTHKHTSIYTINNVLSKSLGYSVYLTAEIVPTQHLSVLEVAADQGPDQKNTE